jgi:flagellar biosynthesis protein FlhG
VKGLEMQNHYEVLEVSRRARAEDIERAYRLATGTWMEGSLALYSVFDDSDAATMRERVRDAYRVLSDEHARRAYDQATFDVPMESQSVEVARLHDAESLGEVYDDELEISLEGVLEASVESADESGEVDYDGGRLRRARMHRGFELEDISQITKISVSYLDAIECEAFDHLPAAVYVRGFVTAYVRVIGLDPARVTASYMARFEAAHRGKTRGRLLGRR